MDPITQRRLFGLFAELLGYPSRRLAVAADECAALLGEVDDEAAALVRHFEAFACQTTLANMEEIYTGVFELDATCHPYVGYHLFGESYKRSAFLLGLKDRYRPHGIDHGVELPDHMAIMLRYLSVNTDPCETEVTVVEALQPALHRMLNDKDEEPPDPDIPKPPAKGDAYHGVLQALRLFLRHLYSEVAAPAELPVFELSPALD